MHGNMKDYCITCLKLFEEYGGKNHVLVQLGLKVVLKPGDMFILRNSVTAQQVEAVEGIRGVSNHFTYENVYA